MPDQNNGIDCCAVILSGGLNTRMKGVNKAFLKIGGRYILDRLVESLRPDFSEILLVTRQPELYSGYSLRVVEDIYKDRSSLVGIHAGLVNARADFAFMVPCDTPFLQTGLVDLLLDELEPGLDVVVPFYDGHYQPLCAIYSKRCISVIEDQLSQGQYKIIDIYEQMNVRVVPAEKLQAADPEMLSFLNVNTPDAHAACQKLAAEPSHRNG
ncbi:MAG: molybdenum cofactor guanylyltransferase [Desulfobacteraceae bacterium]